MTLPATRPSIVTSDQLLTETATGIALLELAAVTFKTGKPLISGVEDRAAYFLDPVENRMFQVFDKVRAYGFEDRPCCIATEDIFHAFAFMESAWPLLDFFGDSTLNGCNASLQAALARDKLSELDHSRQLVIHGPGHPVEYWNDLPGGMALGLTVQEVALLTGLEEQSIRNELSSDKSIPREIGEQSKQLEIPVEFAATWLLGKGRFQKYQPPRSENHISVPVAKDGSFFNVNLKRKKGYTIGKKGEERPYELFIEALSALEKMTTPYWRRPSQTTGVPGIVRGVRWESKSRKEIGLD